MAEEPTETSAGGGVTGLRRPAFMFVTVAFLLFLYLFSPFSSLFLGWFVDFEDNISHRVHEVTFGILFAMMLIGVAVQFRKPEANVAGVQQAIVVSVLLALVVAGSTGWEWTALLYVVPPLAIAGLHPARNEITAIRRPPGGGLFYLALPAALPFLVEFVDEFDKAVKEVRGHQAHWGGMATFALAIVGLALLAAARPRGWRLVAWTTGLSAIVFGVASLRFPFDASARPDLRAFLAIAWGLVFLLTAERIARKDRLRPSASSEPKVPPRAEGAQRPPVLRRAGNGRLLGGVAAGIARRYGVPVAAVRVLAFFPFIGLVLYLLAWWRIPMEQPGDLVEPPGHRRAHPLARAVVVAPALAIAMFAGLTVYDVADTSIAPPVPHDIMSRSPDTCLECHTSGVEHAPVIDPYTHNFFSEFASRRSRVPFCGECHRLPPPSLAGSVVLPAPDGFMTAHRETQPRRGLADDDFEMLRRALASLATGETAP